MKYSFVFIFILIFSFGCEKCKFPVDTEWQEGVIQFTGEPELDGCGWLLFYKGESYYISSLEEEFMIDGLDVWFKGKVLDENYACGRGQTEYAIQEISKMIVKPWKARCLSSYPDRKTSMDAFSMDSVYVEGDSLHLYVGYSGGCAIHQFNLWILETGLDEEGETHLMPEHIGNDDVCEAYLREWLSFSLRPLREFGKSEVTFWLRGSPEMSMLFGPYIYKY